VATAAYYGRFAVDRFGGRALIAAVCPVLLISAHLVLAFDASSPPTLPLVAQGIACTLPTTPNTPHLT
jgi:nitrate/nitrite transporter NarK